MEKRSFGALEKKQAKLRATYALAKNKLIYSQD
jgi:hypothetical protein